MPDTATKHSRSPAECARVAIVASLAFTLALPLGAGCEPPDRPIDDEPDAGVELQEILVAPATLDMPEGSTGRFEVTLRYDPRATVTVEIWPIAPLAVAPAVLTFTSADYAVPHVVTATLPIDTNTTSETSTITISGAGAARAGTVAVRSIDNTQIDLWGWPPKPPFRSVILMATDFAVAYRIDVDIAGDVDAFHAYVPAGSGGYSMALYTDHEDRPGALVAELPAGRLHDGTNDAPIADGPRLDQPTYFLAIRFATDIVIPYAAPGTTGWRCIRDFSIPPALLAPWPASFDATECGTDRAIHVWLTTRHQ